MLNCSILHRSFNNKVSFDRVVDGSKDKAP